MHEGAIVHSLFELAKDIKDKENLKTISVVKIVVGKFHQIVEEVMMTNFEYMRSDYPGFENSELKMSEVDVKVKCEDCGHEFTIYEPIFLCPNCESFKTEMITGKELYIESIEAER